jgi:hypothetical protein
MGSTLRALSFNFAPPARNINVSRKGASKEKLKAQRRLELILKNCPLKI